MQKPKFVPKGGEHLKKLITNIFRSQILDSDGIKVSLFSIMGDLDEDKSERIGYWFSYKYHTPSTVYHFEGNHCLAISATGSPLSNSRFVILLRF